MAIFGAQYELLIGDPYSITREEIIQGPTVPLRSKLKPLEDDIQNADLERTGFKLAEHNIKFSINKTKNGSTPNNMNITVDNLPDQVVNYLGTRTGQKTMILLKAGFETPGIDTVFVGNLEKYTDNFNQPTRKTTITVSDGGANYQEAKTYRYYPTGTSVDVIINDLISDTFLPKGGANVYATDETTIRPLYFNGSVVSQLNKLANMYKYNFSVQNGAVYWTPAGRARDIDALLLSAETGLIGTVDLVDNTQGISQNTPSEINRGIHFKALLNAHIIPETVVFVESSTITGAFKVSKVVHMGNLAGKTWHSEVWAEEVELL